VVGGYSSCGEEKRTFYQKEYVVVYIKKEGGLEKKEVSHQFVSPATCGWGVPVRENFCHARRGKPRKKTREAERSSFQL